MLVLRIFSGRILILIFLLLISFWFLYLLSKLSHEEDVVTECSWCRTMGYKSVVKDLQLQDKVADKVLESLQMPLFIKQLNLMENGTSVLYHDQFVLKGLMELSLIRKSIDNIFFVESSCVVGSSTQRANQSAGFTLDARQACGVESTARANPDRPVFVLHSCLLTDDFALSVPEYARAILELHNVFVVPLDLAELSKGWLAPLPSSTTTLGLLALWQFGGTYCDLDTLVLRSLHPLGTNYCGYRDDNLLIGDLVLNFEPLGYGHTVVTQILNDLSQIIEKGVWKEDDTYLTQVVIEQCSQLPQYLDDCNKLTIYDSTVLFVVGLRDLRVLLSENLVDEFVDKTKNSAYNINYFSRLYSDFEDKEPTQLYLSLAKEFCPGVYTRNNHSL